MLLPAVTGEVTGLRWYLPVRTPQDRNVENQADAGVTNANWSLMRDTALQVDKIAQRFTVEGGDVGDPEAAPNQAFGVRDFQLDQHGRGAIPLGGGRSLAFDAPNATVTVQQGGLSATIWGANARQPGDRDVFELEDGTRLTIETAESGANGVTPVVITIESEGRSTTLRAVEEIA
jgi:hypothetical protein